MTGKPVDPEEIIRVWLADSAPDRAPTSLRETLELEASRPAGQAGPWPRLGHDRLRLAGRIAAGLTILAIAGAGAYFYGTSRTSEAGPATSASPTEPPRASHTTSSSPGAAPLLGDWHLVDTQFVDDQPGALGVSHITTVAGLSSGGFVAFVFDPALDKTVVFRSSDGATWVEVGSLPTKNATVTGVTDSGGQVVAVGYAHDQVANVAAPIAWTSTDLQTWSAAVLSAPANTGALMIKLAPHGFLVWGMELTQRTGLHFNFWMSTDGTSWRAVAGPNLPAGGAVEDLSANSAGFVIRSNSDGLIETWHSIDGATWANAWTGPASSGPDLYSMGRPTMKAPDGTYVTLGSTTLRGTPSDPVTWTSDDLTHWTIAGRTQSGGGSLAMAASVPGGFVGAGVFCQNVAGCPNGSVAVWTSVDALTWDQIPGAIAVGDSLGGLSPNGVASDGTHVIVVLKDDNDRIRLLVGTERT